MNFFKKLFGGNQNNDAANKNYYERDNIGLRQQTKGEGESYFVSLFTRDPESILFYFFPDKAKAESALSEVPCIKIAKDSGKFICTEIINFGVFEAYDEDGRPIWAALLAGKNLTVETWEEGKKAFIKNGGRARREDKIDNMPHRTVQPKANKTQVKFIKKENRIMAGFPATQEIYEASSKSDAIEFLKGKTVSQKSYFIVVDTPQGKVVKDIQGIFDN